MKKENLEKKQEEQVNDSSNINLRGKDLTRFPPFEKILNFQIVSLQYNKINSFESLSECPNLRKLYLDCNLISSFEKAKKQPKLSVISLLDNQRGRDF